MDPTEQARLLVLNFLATDLASKVILDPNPPSLYGVSTDNWMFFRIDNATLHVGASRYVAVHKLTSEIRDLGWLGE